MYIKSRELWYIPTYRFIVQPSPSPLFPEDGPDLSSVETGFLVLYYSCTLKFKTQNLFNDFSLLLQTQTESSTDKLAVPTNVADVPVDLVWAKSGGGV